MGDIDKELRKRLRAWLRYYWLVRYERQGKTQDAMASDMGIKPPTLSNALNPERRTIGLDVFVAIHETFNIRADELIHTDPPLIEPAPGGAGVVLPSVASGSAQPRRRAGRGAQ